MNNYNWSKFKRKIYIKAPLIDIFDAWTKPHNITTWFIKEAKYTDRTGNNRAQDETVQNGDEYYWDWHQNLQSSGKVIEVVPNKLFKFTFGNKEKGSDEKVIVSVEFKSGDGETEYTLTQENMGGADLDMAQYHLSCNMGWSFFMTNMKAVYENGIDLREHDPVRAMDTRALSL
ncbi:MAG: hypothetical protein HeimC2_07300 [Candidatus Heimdallarchaeota archaeon LC_2]|nr:MAG: hypothetical protein HeimC2_07300 [Candidatus Heimdallarchaeota archaeon LC_2]